MIVHHTGIIVKDIKKSKAIYEKLGYFCVSDFVIDNNQNNNILFLTSHDKTQTIELIEPLNETSTIHNFTVGYHHICYDVSTIPDFLSYFKSLRIGKIITKPLIAPALNNSEVVFAFLNNGSFIEFILSR